MVETFRLLHLGYLEQRRLLEYLTKKEERRILIVLDKPEQ